MVAGAYPLGWAPFLRYPDHYRPVMPATSHHQWKHRQLGCCLSHPSSPSPFLSPSSGPLPASPCSYLRPHLTLPPSSRRDRQRPSSSMEPLSTSTSARI